MIAAGQYLWHFRYCRNSKSGAAHAPQILGHNRFIHVPLPRPPPNHLVRLAILQARLLRLVPNPLPGIWWALRCPIQGWSPCGLWPTATSYADTMPKSSFSRGKGAFLGLHRPGAVFRASLARDGLHQLTVKLYCQPGETPIQTLLLNWMVRRSSSNGRDLVQSSGPEIRPKARPRLCTWRVFFSEFHPSRTPGFAPLSI